MPDKKAYKCFGGPLDQKTVVCELIGASFYLAPHYGPESGLYRFKQFCMHDSKGAVLEWEFLVHVETSDIAFVAIDALIKMAFDSLLGPEIDPDADNVVVN